MTGANFWFFEVAAKRLALLHDLVPKAARIAVLVNPTNIANTESILREMPEAARAIGLQIQILNASSRSEIDAAFETIVRERADGLFIAPDASSQAAAVNLQRWRRATACLQVVQTVR